MADTFYYWDQNTPSNIDREESYQCFVTGEMIDIDDDAYWTDEFDCYISEKGYQMIQNAYTSGDLNREWEIIYGEWYAKDEAITGREEMWHRENSNSYDVYDPDNPYYLEEDY